ncbi:MAG: CocE/NonD family hydrolase [Desulfobacteraceae bacterium]|nr:MAG: CocE/NonD family hydrolase [Desulfobacteraceae bacterium]
MAEKIRKKEIFGTAEIETIYRETRRPAPPADKKAKEGKEENWDGLEEKSLEGAGHGFCSPFHPRTYLAEEGILCEQDVPVTLRDGTVIYTDIYRPEGATDIPVIVSWSYFGKRPGDGFDEWQIIGVPPGTVSRMAKFESPDPAFWCRHGYAVANVDPRGVGHSQGDVNMFGTQDGRDGYDFIEWVATEHWCNGKVGMGGNSGVAMTQWRIAAEQPPHLACIAPWEGTGDLYRESLYEGGIPALGFNDFIVGSLTGTGYVDDTAAMAIEHPFLDEYWEDKIPKWRNIRIPVSTTVCWNHFHLRGSMEGFRRIRSTKKWLRTHREFEWPDTYCTAGLSDLKLFYDRYLKEIRNGWELTPRVRLEVMDAYEYDFQSNRPEKEFPLARTQYKKLFVDAAKGALSFVPVAGESKVSYEAETGSTTFDIRFEEDTEITGFMKLRLWVEAAGNDDMDLFIAIRKLDEQGDWLPVNVLGEPHPGAWGKMRVSRRELDEKLSTDFQPIQAHRRDQKLKPGEIVPIEIEIWPHSRIWHKGQQLQVLVSGHYIREGWFEPFSWELNNKGKHVIHSGGKYDSYLQVPVVPPRYRAGDYVYR